MTEVRVRLESEAKGGLLGEVPLKNESFDDVLSLLRRWGGIYLDDPGIVIDDFSGRFVMENGRIYFEVIAHDFPE